MMTRRGRGHWIGLACAVVLIVSVPSLASGATSVRVLAAPHLTLIHPTLAPAPPVAIGGHVLRHLANAPGYAAAGTQGTSPGLEGTTVTLARCATVCTDNYRPASTGAIPAGHWVEQVTFTVTQPASTGTALGFDAEVAVHLSTGWIDGNGYFSTGLSTRAAPATITLHLFIDLGATRPTVSAVIATVNECTSTTGCP